MSFVITMYVPEGIVMASDSRLTLNTEQKQGEKRIVQVGVGMSDTNYRTFLVPGNIGISTYGAAEIKGVPIAVYIQSFVQEHFTDTEMRIAQIPTQLLAYFRQFDPPPATQFHIAGYQSKNSQDETETGVQETVADDVPKQFLEYFRQLEPSPDIQSQVSGYKPEDGRQEQLVWHVDIAQGQIGRLNPPGQQGASWGGEGDILARLIQPVGVLNQDGTVRQNLPYFPIPWQFFTLQDAIDFCIFAVRTTIEATRFQARPKTVGGPIDVLVVQPHTSFWVKRKELRG